jgi:hypothetical protein
MDGLCSMHGRDKCVPDFSKKKSVGNRTLRIPILRCKVKVKLSLCFF